MERETIQLAAETPARTEITLSVELDDLLLASGGSVADSAPRDDPPAAALPGVVIGRLVELEDGRPLVEFPGQPAGRKLAARTTVPLAEEQLGCDVVLMFDAGDLRQPIVLGVVQPATAAAEEHGGPPAAELAAEIDGRRITLTAQEQIVLRCGQASLTLTRAGKVLIRGAYVSSRSSGVNRIKGGSVQIN